MLCIVIILQRCTTEQRRNICEYYKKEQYRQTQIRFNVSKDNFKFQEQRINSKKIFLRYLPQTDLRCIQICKKKYKWIYFQSLKSGTVLWVLKGCGDADKLKGFAAGHGKAGEGLGLSRV